MVTLRYRCTIRRKKRNEVTSRRVSKFLPKVIVQNLLFFKGLLRNKFMPALRQSIFVDS